MNVADENEVQDARSTRLRMPSGMLGFEHIKNFDLIETPADDPFLWLQVCEQPNLAFLLISPFLVAEDYSPDIPDADVETLELDEPGDALVLNVVTLRGPSSATVNLKGPIVVNRRTGIAKQVVLNNAANYSVQHPVAIAG